VVFEKLFEKYRKEILHAKLLMVEGRLQREKEVVHVIVSKCIDLTKMLGKLVEKELDDESVPFRPQDKRTQIRQDASKQVFHGGRNFK
jgi:error-prone DNA polymerase